MATKGVVITISNCFHPCAWWQWLLDCMILFCFTNSLQKKKVREKVPELNISQIVWKILMSDTNLLKSYNVFTMSFYSSYPTFPICPILRYLKCWQRKKLFPSLKSVLRFSNCISLIRNSKENVKECTQGLWELFRVKLSSFSFLCFLLRRISWSRYCTGLWFGCWSWNVATISENLTSIGLLIITSVQNSIAQYVGAVWAYTRSPEVVASSP